MREILFRGKRIHNGDWVYGSLIKMGPAGYVNYYIHPYNMSTVYTIHIDPTTVGQYANQTDKSGQKIFEGDICRHRVSIGGKILDDDVGPVCLRRGSWTIIDKFGCVAVGQCSPEDLEVIGNIHDNPELLEVQDEN